MEDTATPGDNDLWNKLETSYRERARSHRLSANLDMIIIIFTLLICIGLFLGADRLSGWLFKSSAERQADIELTQAGTEIKRALASLGEPAGEFIRSLPPMLRPLLEDYLSSLKKGKEAQSPSSAPTPDQTDSFQNGAASGISTPSRNPPEVEVPWIAPKSKERSTPSTAPFSAGEVVPGPDASELRDLVSVYRELVDLYEKNAELHLLLEQEREAYSGFLDRTNVEYAKIDSQIQVAQINADAQLAIATEEAQRQLDVETEKTTQLDGLHGLILTGLTRVGSVVLLIWIVSIFVGKRQRSVRLATFYLAVADALALSEKGKPESFKQLLPSLLPASSFDLEKVETPAEYLAKIVGLARGSH